MNLIHQNPYRILGLQINASDKEIAKRVSELEAYASIGKEMSFETDFPCLSSFERTADTIREASNRIETAEGRLFHTFFWFWQYNSVDELAFEVLRDGNVDKSIKLLENQLKSENLTPQYYSTAKNLFCLYLASYANGSVNPECLSKCILWAGRFFENELLNGYVTWISGPQYPFDRQKTLSVLVEEFIKLAKPLVNKPNGVTVPKFISMFSSFSPSVQKSISSRFSSKHVLNIEKAIKASENGRKQSPERANTIGENLYVGTIHDLESLQAILSDQDVQYQTVADNLADELLGCSIAYFNYHLDLNHGEDPGENALKLVRFAEAIVAGKKVQLRIQKNKSTMEEHVETWAANKKWMSIKADYDAITKRINALPDIDKLSDSEVKSLKGIVDCFVADSIVNLTRIRNATSRDNEEYLDISSSVVSHALNMCIEYANRARNSEEIMSVMMSLVDLDMDGETRDRYQKNRTILLKNFTVVVGQTKAGNAQKTNTSSYQYTQHQTSPPPAKSYWKNFFRVGGSFRNFLKNWDGFPGLLKFCSLFLFAIWLFSVVFDANKSHSPASQSYQTSTPAVQSVPEGYKLDTPAPVPSKSTKEVTSKNLDVAPNGKPWPNTSAYLNGYSKKNAGGLSNVTIDNSQNNSDVFVTLNYLSGPQPNPVRLIMIKAYSQFEIRNIKTGHYDVRYKDLTSGHISKSESFDLYEFPSESGTEYSNMTMTLYKVSHGNMQTTTISEDDLI